MNFNHLFKKTVRSGFISICLLGLFVSYAYADCGGMFSSSITKDIEVESFHSLDISGEANVAIRQGEIVSLSIKAPEKVIEDLKIKIRSGKLIIEPDDCDREYNVSVTMKEIKSLEFSGSVNAESAAEIQTEDLKLDVSGSADIKLAVKADSVAFDSSGSSNVDMTLSVEKLSIDSSGSSDLTFKGTTETLSVDTSGSTDLNALELTSKNCIVRSSGSGDIKLNVEESLDVKTSGSVDVEYKGQPRISMSSSGSTNLKALK